MSCNCVIDSERARHSVIRYQLGSKPNRFPAPLFLQAVACFYGIQKGRVVIGLLADPEGLDAHGHERRGVRSDSVRHLGSQVRAWTIPNRENIERSHPTSA